MRITVCEDCQQDTCAIRDLLPRQEVKLCGSAESLIAGKLHTRDEAVSICFVSTSEYFYRKAYDLYVVQYLIRLVGREELDKLLEVEKIFVRNQEKTLGYSWPRVSGAIPYGKILYISSREHVLSIHCTDGRAQEITGKLNALRQQTCGDTFLRCHKSFTVNMYHVREFAGIELTLADEREKALVSRRYHAAVQECYRKIMFEEVEWK